ncbi:MAG: 50S ribosomal protein L2 [Planctomycetota bacterium]|nr:50S ribosomal protein L2 [Planctomycetota bacterium]
MPVKHYKATSAGRRFGMVSDFLEITTNRPEKSLLRPLRGATGRNAHGHITSRQRGGGHKRMYRLVDFRRNKFDVQARVVAIEYDPNRSARIARLHYLDGAKAYILAPKDLKVGTKIVSGEKVEPKPGNCMPLRNIPLGLIIHNIELIKGRGGQLVRSAGGMAQLVAKEGRHAHISLPSGEIRKVLLDCRATIGQLGNIEHQNIVLGKAGRMRWLGRRPHVRGVAKSPYCHPMGGGEGRTKGGRHPCSPWGKPSKGGKTRKPKKLSNSAIVRRRKKKR